MIKFVLTILTSTVLLNAADLSMKQMFLTLPIDELVNYSESESNPTKDRARYLKPLPHVKVLIDEKNGYLSIKDSSSELGSEFTVVKWKCSDGTILAGFAYHLDGGDEDTDSYSFYQQRKNSWEDVTNTLFPSSKLPIISLSNGEEIPAVLDLILPQKGTTIIGKYVGVGEYSYPGDHSLLDEYYSIIRNEYPSPISFKWNKQAVKFEKQ